MTASPSVDASLRRTRRRRTFSVGSWRFECTRQRVLDTIIDGASCVMESIVYWLGPVLIALASSIIGVLAYTFFTILLPMIQRKYADRMLRIPIVSLHTSWVVYLLVQIIFNYVCCVMQKHSGPLYDRVVRELARATEFPYPESPDAVLQHRRMVQDLFTLRIQQRRQRQANGEQEPPQAIRSWMLQGPFEWGYCAKTNQAKPPRSHYDHVTNVLVMNLDHYCPWMFNAVGYFNYRYFVTFLIYIFLGMIYGAAITAEPFLLSKSISFRRQMALERKEGALARLSPLMPLRSEKLLVTLAFMLCAAVGLAILLLGGFHLYLSVMGLTTIEFHGRWGKNGKVKHPYSIGTKMGNWKRVFGRRWLHALLVPQRRDPEYLPVTVPGHSGLRIDALAPLVVAEEEELVQLV